MSAATVWPTVAAPIERTEGVRWAELLLQREWIGWLAATAGTSGAWLEGRRRRRAEAARAEADAAAAPGDSAVRVADGLITAAGDFAAMIAAESERQRAERQAERAEDLRAIDALRAEVAAIRLRQAEFRAWARTVITAGRRRMLADAEVLRAHGVDPAPLPDGFDDHSLDTMTTDG